MLISPFVSFLRASPPKISMHFLDFKLSPCSECCMLFFWVIPRCLNFVCRRFGTHCLFHLHTYPSMKMEQSVPKRRHIKFRRRRITQKKAYNCMHFSSPPLPLLVSCSPPNSSGCAGSPKIIVGRYVNLPLRNLVQDTVPEKHMRV